MKIEMTSKTAGLNGGPEVWVRVFSNEVLDWPRVEKLLSEEQASDLAALGPKKLSYFPHTTTAEERAEHGYSFEEFWVWAKAGKKASV